MNAVPAVCVPMAPPPAASTRKLFSTPGFTVNALLVPLDPFVAVSVKLPVFEIVTLRSEEHTSELQSQSNLVCRLLLEKKNRLHANLNKQVGILQTTYRL